MLNLVNKNLVHISLILDGNGRFAKSQNKPRSYGHKIGLRNLKEIVLFANKINLAYLTIFTFSTENWKRPLSEVNYLMRIINLFFNKSNVQKMMDYSIKIKWIGFEDKLSKKLINKIKNCEKLTNKNTGLTLSIAFNYGAKQEIISAVNKVINVKKTNNDFSLISEKDFNSFLLSGFLPPVDLLIRTSGEQRISNFLLWQLDYAEIIFQKVNFPEYTTALFESDINWFFSRKRRFGTIDEGDS